MSFIMLTLPLLNNDVRALRSGDIVKLTGYLYTARDAAHKRMIKLLDEGKVLPFDISGQTLYYVGPAPASPGHAVGAAGPTSSYRMDQYTPRLLELGLNGMIGKGMRSEAVIAAMVKYGAVYFGAVGGTAAYISQHILKSDVIAYPELGTEAIYRLDVVEFPAIVLVDTIGGNLYVNGPKQFRNI